MRLGVLRSPAMTSGQTAPKMRDCPYCFEPIRRDATRCQHCAGHLRHCPRCGENVGLAVRQKFVGLFRGGMKEQARCVQCGRVLDGPRV